MSRREKKRAAPEGVVRVAAQPTGGTSRGRGKSGPAVSTPQGLSSQQTQRRLSIAVLVLAVLIFYWIPLTDAGTTLQWDAIDYHLSIQKYFGDEIRNGRVPFWTEYAYSGFPFLADPQVGAFYPLNWPFFLYGVTAEALKWELALHALLACVGVFLLALEWIESPPLAAMAAMMFGFSGFFAGHSSHIGMFQSAAWLPWLLWGAHRALVRGRSFALIGAGLAGACLVLAGHFQTALYSFSALFLYAVGVAAIGKSSWRRASRTLAGIGLLTVLLSAVQILPTYELTSQSIRACTKLRAENERHAGVARLRYVVRSQHVRFSERALHRACQQKSVLPVRRHFTDPAGRSGLRGKAVALGRVDAGGSCRLVRVRAARRSVLAHHRAARFRESARSNPCLVRRGAGAGAAGGRGRRRIEQALERGLAGIRLGGRDVLRSHILELA